MKDLTLIDIVLLLLVSSVALIVTSFPTMLGMTSTDGLASSLSCKLLTDQRHTAMLMVDHRQALPLQTSVLMSNGSVFEPLLIKQASASRVAMTPTCMG